MTRGPTPAVELSAVRAGYGGIDVLHGVDLTAHFGRVLALLGPNGGGKSTLLGTVAGLVGCSAGEVRIAGTVATGVTTRRRARTGVCLMCPCWARHAARLAYALQAFVARWR